MFTLRRFTLLAACSILPVGSPLLAAEMPTFSFSQSPGKVSITIDDHPLATYVYEDENIPRPYFAQVHAPGGTRVTRNHPPAQGKEPTDHATMHPGLWMAFGDINGNDYWRNRAKVRHESFIEQPRQHSDKAGFAVRNLYLTTDVVEDSDKKNIVCGEICRYTFHALPEGILLIWDSTFSTDQKPCTFGDQEEMGLGIRVAGPLMVQRGGTILDAEGRKDEREVWGESAPWCDYSGTIDGRHVGITILCHPENFRRSWFHARDYGLLLANPFGRKAFGKGPASELTVGPNKPLRLCHGVLLHANSGDKRPDFGQVFKEYVRLCEE